jgi:hypothetical protein
MLQTVGVPGRVRSMRVGIILASLSIAHGFGLGGVFGAFEKNIKDHLKAEAEAVADSVYHGDAAAMKKVTDKSWSYFKRAHMHGAAIGTAALALSLMMIFLVGTHRTICGVISAALGAGALGYSLFWLMAALRAPGMGSTGAAKESLQWLAVPAAGLAIVGLLAALVLFVGETFVRRPAAD